MKRMSFFTQLFLIFAVSIPCAFVCANLADEALPTQTPTVQATALQWRARAVEVLAQHYRDMEIR